MIPFVKQFLCFLNKNRIAEKQIRSVNVLGRFSPILLFYKTNHKYKILESGMGGGVFSNKLASVRLIFPLFVNNFFS